MVIPKSCAPQCQGHIHTDSHTSSDQKVTSSVLLCPRGQDRGELVPWLRCRQGVGARSCVLLREWVFVEEGWENSLTLEITLSPQRQRLLPVFTRVLSPLWPLMRTCQREQGWLSRRGIATLLYVPRGTAGRP